MNDEPVILVTGGTGFLGSYLLRKLLIDGHPHIRSTKRASSQFGLVEDIKDQIEWIETDILDVFGLEDAMQGVSQVYHCAAIVSFDPRQKDQMKQINVTGTANVVNAALAEKIDKMVYVSSIAAIGRSHKHPKVTETNRWEPNNLNSAYAKTKYMAEKEVWRGVAEGLNVAIINPSVILGSGHWKTGSIQAFYEIWKGLKFFPPGQTGFVDVRDVAELMTKMMQSDVSAERFIANGGNLTYKDFFEQIAASIQKPAPRILVTPLISAAAWRFEWLKSKLTGKCPMITKETAAMSANSFSFDNRKSINTFHFSYRPIDKTIAETGSQMLEASKMEFCPLTLAY